MENVNLGDVRKTQMGAKGVKYALVSTVTDGAATYSAAKDFSEFVKLTESVQKAEAKFYSNDRLSESVESFKYCDLTYDNKGLSDNVTSDIFGVKKSDDGEMTYGAGNVCPYLGLAFYRVLLDNGATYYEGVFYPYVKAALGNSSYETKGENVNLAGDTTTLVASPLSDSEATWKKTKIFELEKEAVEWVDAKLGTSI